MQLSLLVVGSADVFNIVVLVLIGAFAALIFLRFRLQDAGSDARFLDSLPALIWAERRGKILWANDEYRLLQSELEEGVVLQIARFESDEEPMIHHAAKRMTITTKTSDDVLHFDVTKHLFKGVPYFYAQSAETSVRAEQDRERFVKNMSETFAYLDVGVAVFDKHHDLSLFNPALSELLGLASGWLAMKPSLRAFLDRLHDKGDLPEPKNFKKWRAQILSLEESDQGKLYLEDWNMPNGRVLRIKAQSYPRGAVALFVEDISDQVSVETEYRLEIRRLYNAFDSLMSAVAIFNAAGELSFASDGFEVMWQTDISKSILVADVQTVSKVLMDATYPTPVWGELRDFVSQLDSRACWAEEVTKKNGETILVRMSPLVDGQTMCEFVPVAAKNAKERKSTLQKQKK